MPLVCHFEEDNMPNPTPQSLALKTRDADDDAQVLAGFASTTQQLSDLQAQVASLQSQVSTLTTDRDTAVNKLAALKAAIAAKVDQMDADDVAEDTHRTELRNLIA